MAKWVVTTYDSIAAMETAVELLDTTVTLHVLGFKEGALQKIVVVSSA